MLVTNFLMRLVKHKIFKYLKFIKKKNNDFEFQRDFK